MKLNKTKKEYKIVYKDARPGDQRHMQADISKAAKLLKWKPKMKFENGMKDVMDWAKEVYGK